MAVTNYKFDWRKVPADSYTITKISDDEYEVVFVEYPDNPITLKAIEGEIENV